MKIPIFVIAVHIILALAAVISIPVIKEKRTKLVVKTVSQRPPKAAVPVAAPVSKPKQEKKKESPKPAPAPVQTPIKKQAPAAKPAPTIKPNKSVPPIKKPTKVTKPTPSAPVVPQHLLRELEETIAKIEGKQEKLHPQKKKETVQKIKPLQSENISALEIEDEEDNYKDLLVLYLHQSLNLPDYGDVKVQLTLRQDGSVEKMKVLKADSDKNRKYLEIHLPRLKFPPLQGSSEKKENTFILTFGNEL